MTIRPSGGDDGAAINHAINMLPESDGTILLQPGTYRIQATIVVTKNGVKLRGSGGDSG